MYKTTPRYNNEISPIGDQTLVEVARKIGITSGYSCLSGRCSTCKVKVLKSDSFPRATLNVSNVQDFVLE